MSNVTEDTGNVKAYDFSRRFQTMSALPFYPSGSLTAWSEKLGKWRVAIPVGTKAEIDTAKASEPGEEPTHEELTPRINQPGGAEVVEESKIDDVTGQTPFYKKWWFWAAVGGVVVLGAGAYYLVQRKKDTSR